MLVISFFVMTHLFGFCYSSTVDSHNALQRLKECGFLTDKPGVNDYSPEDMTTAVKKFQLSVALTDTGYFDEQTNRKISVSKCQELKTTDKNLLRVRRYTLEGSKWSKKNLTYTFLSYPENLQREDVESEIRRAFDEWSKYADLAFIKVENTQEVDIKIEFDKYTHKDDYAFDGDGEDLAHGFYPNSGGDIHFDKSEKWTIRSEKGVNLFAVAVHEIGHVLGIDHSSIKQAVMWPVQDDYNASYALHKDEIDAIQSLYGPRFNETFDTKEIICDRPGLDAAVRAADDRYYVFKKNFYWDLVELTEETFEDYNDTIRPKIIQDKWPGLLGNIDAAFTDNLGRTFFFTGDRYWRFSGFKIDPNYPRKISTGFPGIPDHIDAAFSKPGPVNELYFFKGDKIWKYVRANTPHISEEWPKLISEVYKGLPNDLDCAIRQYDGATYFFKGYFFLPIFDKDMELKDPMIWIRFCKNYTVV